VTPTARHGRHHANICVCRHGDGAHNTGACSVYGCTCTAFTAPPGAWTSTTTRRCALVYSESGRVAHILKTGTDPNGNDRALCGFAPWPLCWRGFSNQIESAILNSLRTCKNCHDRHEESRFK
jgi:hypothetical protein